LDATKFAESLGLAVPPRVRFLEKHKKLAQQRQTEKEKKPAAPAPVKSKKKVNEESGSESSSTGSSAEEEEEEAVKKIPAKDKNDFIALVNDSDEEDDDGEDVLTVKRRHHDLQTSAEDQANDAAESFLMAGEKVGAAGKGVSKVQAAKKLLKKKIVANSKLLFDEATGEAVVPDGERSQAASALGRQYAREGAGGGIDIAQAREVLRAEDKFDREAERRRQKERRREMKQKAKEEAEKKRKREEEEESDSEESVDLSWLPDPDKVQHLCLNYHYMLVPLHSASTGYRYCAGIGTSNEMGPNYNRPVFL
jgi:ATP-dependent RNA helicase DDX10/DBP4